MPLSGSRKYQLRRDIFNWNEIALMLLQFLIVVMCIMLHIKWLRLVLSSDLAEEGMKWVYWELRPETGESSLLLLGAHGNR